jgi:putative heme transporter
MLLNGAYEYLKNNQVIFALILLAAGWLVIRVVDILALFFVAFLITVGLKPVVEFLERRRFPKAIAITLPFAAILLVFFLIIKPFVPVATQQVQDLFENFPEYLNRIAAALPIEISGEELAQIATAQLEGLRDNIAEVTGAVFSAIIGVFAVLIISIYMLADRQRLREGIVKLLPTKHREKAGHIYDKIQERLGWWVRGYLAIAAIVGSLVWILLASLGVENAFALAILAALLEFIPFLGPIIASIPAIIIGLTISPLTAVIIAIGYSIIQQIENHLLAPKIMQRAIGLHPLLVILAIFVGGRLMGIFGALLAIPFTAVVSVIIEELRSAKAEAKDQ